MAKHILKKPLKIEGPHGFTFPVGTEIETTDVKEYVNGMLCRQIIIDGQSYPAYQPEIDEAVKD